MNTSGVRNRAIMGRENATADSGEEDQQLIKAEIHNQRRGMRKTKGVCCCSMMQCCCFFIAVIVMLVLILFLVGSYLMFHEMHSLMNQMRQELKEERHKRKQIEEIRLQEKQLQATGAQWLQRCIGHQAGEYDSFTGVRLLWGAFEIGYTNKQQFSACITEYNNRFSQKLHLN